ncbi:MAG: NAD(P)H-quinone oxidoreductase [Rhodobiaceae bacterium]|nr:NAD(P)H-quinone oxidoreductase [Rhodobiaceae bacterium]
MTAIDISEPGGPDVLKPIAAPLPVPADGQILIKVVAAGVNRPDVLQRMGAYPPPPGAPAGPGLEVAGTVAALGQGADGYEVGDPVCALVAGGGYAEYAVVDARHALPVPAGLTMTEASGLPETCFTVWHNVFERGGLQAGETMLVHGGSSGIGTTAIQIAAARGATVLATAGSAEKCKACEDLGAARAINYREEDFVAVVKEATGGKGADVILDMVGGDYIARNYSAAAIEGRIVQIAFLSGSKAEVDFTRLMIKRLTHTGSTLRPQSGDAKARIAKGLRDNVWPLIEAGRVRPVIHATFPLAEAAAAHRLMETSGHIGKIVLTVD